MFYQKTGNFGEERLIDLRQLKRREKILWRLNWVGCVAAIIAAITGVTLKCNTNTTQSKKSELKKEQRIIFPSQTLQRDTITARPIYPYR